MRKKSKVILGGVGVTLAIIIGIALMVLPGIVEESMNQVDRSNTWPTAAQAEALHKTLRVADMHADTLLWGRNPLEYSQRGHVDLPRLQEGGVVLQVLAAVTKSPSGLNYDSNSADSRDNITALTMAQLWPPRTWTSLLERAVYQSERLHKAANSTNELSIATTSTQLSEFLSARSDREVATLLATEGAHPLQGDINNLQVLWDAGYRMLGLHHFFDNALGGSLHGLSGKGLSKFGKEVVQQAQAMGFIIDVAHSSPAAVNDVLALTTKPIVVSHTGVKGVCDSPRNLTDAQFRNIAATGGLVSIGYWDAVCDISPAGVAKSIAYAVNLLGEDHVALGSDYDGATTVSFDTSQLKVLTHALLEAGLSADAIRKVMGENQLDFFLDQLPDE